MSQNEVNEGNFPLPDENEDWSHLNTDLPMIDYSKVAIVDGQTNTQLDPNQANRVPQEIYEQAAGKPPIQNVYDANVPVPQHILNEVQQVLQKRQQEESAAALPPTFQPFTPTQPIQNNMSQPTYPQTQAQAYQQPAQPQPQAPQPQVQQTQQVYNTGQVPQAQPVQYASYAVPQPQTAPLGRSFFRDDANYYAGFITIQGKRVYFKEIPDSTREWTMNWPHKVSEQLGITIAQFKSGVVFDADPAIGYRFSNLWNEMANRVLIESVVNWELPDSRDQIPPITPEYIDRLPKVIKRKLVDSIVAASHFGNGDEEFFQGSGTSYNQGR